MCNSPIFYILTAACCGCIGCSKSWYLLCHNSSSVADLLRPNTLTINNCHVHYHAHPSDSCDDLFYILSKLMSILFQVLFKAKNPDSPLLAYF